MIMMMIVRPALIRAYYHHPPLPAFRMLPHFVDELLTLLLLLMGGNLMPTFTSYCPPKHLFTEGLYTIHGKPQFRRWVGGKRENYPSNVL